jgi:hypothetical protein
MAVAPACGGWFVPEFIKVLVLDVRAGIPMITRERMKERAKTFGERLWTFVTQHYRKSAPKRPRKRKAENLTSPYEIWRRRSADLNGYYAGNFRGAFMLNYFLAAMAVALATGSLVFLCLKTLFVEEKVLVGILIVLGCLKLGLLIRISLNTSVAADRNWNERSVDYRYLAERLRAMTYLPLIGSFQPPVAMPRRNANLAVRQSAVDWLFNAVIRSVSPASMPGLKTETLQLNGKSRTLKFLRPAPIETLTQVRDRWVGEQIEYHQTNSHVMEHVFGLLENSGTVLNKAVIVFVGIDLLVAGLFLSDRNLEVVHSVTTPVLLFLAAVLPAIVASVNGLRFQSECRRLAERSRQMFTILGGVEPSTTEFAGQPRPAWRSRYDRADDMIQKMIAAAANPETDRRAWTLSVLHFSESVADIFLQEVAEWSVLYAKELPEV